MLLCQEAPLVEQVGAAKPRAAQPEVLTGGWMWILCGNAADSGDLGWSPMGKYFPSL